MTIEKLNFAPVSRFYQENDKKIILAIVVLLTIYLLAFAAKLTWQIIPSSNSSAIASITSKQTLSNVRPGDSKTNLDKLLALNLFGNAEAKPQEVAVQDVTEAPETKLNISLSGVVSSPDPSVGAAVIEYRNSQSTYGIGDKIEGTEVTLDEIYSDRVIIKNRLTRETLMLDGIDFEESNRLRVQNRPIEDQSSTIQTNAQGPSRQGRSIPLNQSALDIVSIKQRLREEPASFADFIRLTPHLRDGAIAGYSVSPGKDPSLFKEVGLQDGDIVIELNGYDLADASQALEAVALINEAQSFDFEVLRNDEVISLNLDIPRD